MSAVSFFSKFALTSVAVIATALSVGAFVTQQANVELAQNQVVAVECVNDSTNTQITMPNEQLTAFSFKNNR